MVHTASDLTCKLGYVAKIWYPDAPKNGSLPGALFAWLNYTDAQVLTRPASEGDLAAHSHTNCLLHNNFDSSILLSDNLVGVVSKRNVSAVVKADVSLTYASITHVFSRTFIA